MRLYAFQNFYLAGVQAGIQTQHSTTRLFVKYQPSLEEDFRTEILYEWATNHETTIILNGGDCNKLAEIYQVLSKMNTLPFAAFTEEGVNNSLTNISVVVTEKFYEASKNLREKSDEFNEEEFSTDELEFVKLLAYSKLMN